MGSSRRALAVSAYGASLLALLYAAVSAYWAVGGKLGIDTLGGSLERLARSVSPGARALAWAVVVLKLIGALLALAFVRPAGERIRRSHLAAAGALAGTLLTLYGAVQVAGEALVETRAVRPSPSVDWVALRWHLGLWDMWFLVWGVLLLLAVHFYRRPQAQMDSVERPPPLSDVLDDSKGGEKDGRSASLLAAGQQREGRG